MATLIRKNTNISSINGKFIDSLKYLEENALPSVDTILNLGLNAKTLGGLIKQTGDERFGYDAYRRFIQLFGKVALDIDDEHFDKHFEEVKNR